MLRKGLAVAVILLFIGVAFTSNIYAKDEEINNGKSDTYFLSRGFLFGTYEVLEYVGFVQGIHIYNAWGNYTINVFGYRYYEKPNHVLLKVDWVQGAWFIGYCNNGRVFGYVFGSLKVRASE